MIIILEGVDGVGKSTIANELQRILPLSTLIKLSGSPKHCDEKEYMQELYYKVYPFLEFVSEEQNIILDRFTTSERVYSPIFKGYDVSYLDSYEELLDSKMDIVQIYLRLLPEKISERIEKKRREFPNEKHPSDELIKKIHDKYEDIVNNDTKFITLIIDASNTVEDTVKEIIKIIEYITGKPLVSEIETAYS